MLYIEGSSEEEEEPILESDDGLDAELGDTQLTISCHTLV